MDKKEIYVLQLAWSNQDSEGINTTLFDDREKAIKKFKEIIEEEKTWTGIGLRTHLTKTVI